MNRNKKAHINSFILNTKTKHPTCTKDHLLLTRPVSFILPSVFRTKRCKKKSSCYHQPTEGKEKLHTDATYLLQIVQAQSF